jgi:hypothetical protein
MKPTAEIGEIPLSEVPPEIRRILRATRKWAEQKQQSDMFDYKEDFVWPKYSEDLCGMCAIAAAELFRRLQRAGITEIELIESNDDCSSHCFVLYKNRVILDVTATQFSTYCDRAICVYDMEMIAPKFVGSEHWKVDNRFTSVYQLRTHQKTVGWPDYQVAR